MANPFDQFAADFQAALPPAPGAPGSQGPPMEQPMSMYGGQPPPAPQPFAMNSFGGPPQYGGPAMGGYGVPPPPPAYAQSPQSSYGQNPYGQSAFTGMQAPPPSEPSYPYASGPYGAMSSVGDLSQSIKPYGAMPPPSDSISAAPPSGGPYAAYGQAPPPQPPPPSQGPPPGTPGSHGMFGLAEPPHNTLPPTAAASASDNAASGNPFDFVGAGPPEPPQPQASAAYADPWGAPPAPAGQPTGYGAPPNYGGGPSMDPQLQQQQQQQLFDPSLGALVPAAQQSNPYAQQINPYGQPPPQQQQPGNFYGQPYGQVNPYGQPNPYSQAPPPPPPVDPFSVFESQALVVATPTPYQQPQQALVPAGPDPTASDDDFWSAFSINAPEAASASLPDQPEDSADVAAAGKEAPKRSPHAPPSSSDEEKKNGDDGLPPGGEWYDARIFTPTLGVMFFKPQELTDSLFLNTDKEMVQALGDRPTVAFIVEGSSARSAGVELGHILLKVNGVDVKNPKDASRLIKEGPRPLPLLFYVPNTDVVVAEGEHMVKYDTRDTTAPNSAKDWKPKYVVIGGIIAQPWMMNMYRSKSEYDIAVIETQARRPVSVKVKQFSLQGARIQNDWQGPQLVKYKNKLHPWKYIVVLPVARNPIKISSPNLTQLKPVHEGIRRVLLAQQRERGGGGGQQSSVGPSRDPYAGGGGGGSPQRDYARHGGSDRGGEDYGGQVGGATSSSGYATQNHYPSQASAQPAYRY